MTEKDRAQQQTEPRQQPKPATNSADAELSDEQLDQVAGGRVNSASPELML